MENEKHCILKHKLTGKYGLIEGNVVKSVEYPVVYPKSLMTCSYKGYNWKTVKLVTEKQAWSQQEIEILKKYKDNLHLLLFSLPNRTLTDCRRKAFDLGFTLPKYSKRIEFYDGQEVTKGHRGIVVYYEKFKKFVKKERYIMGKHLNRLLLPNEKVIFLDKNPDNYSISNLKVINGSNAVSIKVYDSKTKETYYSLEEYAKKHELNAKTLRNQIAKGKKPHLKVEYI